MVSSYSSVCEGRDRYLALGGKLLSVAVGGVSRDLARPQCEAHHQVRTPHHQQRQEVNEDGHAHVVPGPGAEEAEIKKVTDERGSRKHRRERSFSSRRRDRVPVRSLRQSLRSSRKGLLAEIQMHTRSWAINHKVGNQDFIILWIGDVRMMGEAPNAS